MDDGETLRGGRLKYDDSPAEEFGPLTEDILRAVAEEVRTAFPRPLSEPELVLIDVDPRHLHAFWNLPLARLEAARAALAGSKDEDAPLVLRLAHADGHAPFDVEVQGLQGQAYVDIWDEERSYRGTLGLRLADGSLAVLIEGGVATLPPTGPSSLPAAMMEITPPPFGRLGRQRQAEGLVASAAPPPAAPPGVAPAAAPGEPLAEPFPPPPTEAGAFEPALLTAAAPPDAARTAQSPVGEARVSEAPVGEAEGTAAAGIAGAGTAAEPAMPPPGAPAPTPLELENVLSLSSFVLGRETVQLEVLAELRVFGRARPGSELRLFGRRVAIRPDGSFSITRPLPNGALVLTALLSGGEDEGGEG